MFEEEPARPFVLSGLRARCAPRYAGTRRKRLAAVAVLPLAAGWMSLPHRDRFTGPVVQNNQARVTFSYPSEWPRPKTVYAAPDFVVLDLTPEPPRGLARWWAEHVRRVDFASWKTAHVSVQLFAMPDAKSIDTRERELRAGMRQFAARRGKSYTIARFAHPLGPGLKVEIDSPSRVGLPEMHSRNYVIAPLARIGTGPAQVCVFCSGDEISMPQLQSAMQDIVDSVRVEAAK